LNILDLPFAGDGKDQTIGEPVVADGPVAYLTTIPIKAILKRMREAGIPSSVSYSAGTHGCNQILYWLLHYVSTKGLRTKVGFIHLPYLPKQVAKMWEKAPSMYQPSMSLVLMSRGVRIAINTSLELAQDIEMGCGALC
jgi:pyroglutamyl-peptidase